MKMRNGNGNKERASFYRWENWGLFGGWYMMCYSQNREYWFWVEDFGWKSRSELGCGQPGMPCWKFSQKYMLYILGVLRPKASKWGKCQILRKKMWNRKLLVPTSCTSFSHAPFFLLPLWLSAALGYNSCSIPECIQFCFSQFLFCWRSFPG